MAVAIEADSERLAVRDGQQDDDKMAWAAQQVSATRMSLSGTTVVVGRESLVTAQRQRLRRAKAVFGRDYDTW